MGKTDACVKKNKEKAMERQNAILAIIDAMEENGQKITFYGVQKESGASKSYLYKNQIIAERIFSARQNNESKRNEKSKDVIITSLQIQIKKLQSQIKEFERANSESYKQKYERLVQENKELKKQLSVAYEYKIKEK